MLRQILIAGALIAAAGAASAQHPGHGQGRMFEGADANKDGMIARDEFLAARAQHFAKMDKNADGFLDEADREANANKRRARMMRGRADANSDGKISKDEFANHGAPMFDRLDTDGNGALDEKEIAAAKERRRR